MLEPSSSPDAQAQIAQLEALLVERDRRIRLLEEALRLIHVDKYGASREKLGEAPGQRGLFNEAEVKPVSRCTGTALSLIRRSRGDHCLQRCRPVSHLFAAGMGSEFARHRSNAAPHDTPNPQLQRDLVVPEHFPVKESALLHGL